MCVFRCADSLESSWQWNHTAGFCKVQLTDRQQQLLMSAALPHETTKGVFQATAARFAEHLACMSLNQSENTPLPSGSLTTPCLLCLAALKMGCDGIHLFMCVQLSSLTFMLPCLFVCVQCNLCCHQATTLKVSAKQLNKPETRRSN